MPISPEAFDEPWRVVCPRGHTTLRPSQDGLTAYCTTCGSRFDGEELIDRKEEVEIVGSIPRC